MNAAGINDSQFVAELVRRELLRRGWGIADLAERCGMSVGGMANEFSRGFTSRALQWRIEKVFAFSVLLWSPQSDLVIRERCMVNFGVDPRELDSEALPKFCRGLGIRGPGGRRVEPWFEALSAWFAANPGAAKKGRKDEH